MSEARNALIIANYRYEHPDLRQLLAPAQDAESLARVLSDPSIGGFEVRTVINEPSHKVNLEIEGFCDNRKRDDLLLLYFSGHGIKDADGQLYFATIDTQLAHQNVRLATAVSASFVNEVMNRSRSRRQILLLDCCYSGAFKEGMLAKGGKRVGAGEQLEGQGRIVLTASDALQYSFEGGQVQGEGIRSVFTRILVHGLETGEADLDRDGSFSLDEVYDYVYGKVADEQPKQRPTKMGYVEGKIFIGNNPRPIAAELPTELQQSLDNPLPWVRLGAVQQLEKLLEASSKGLALAAKAALTSLANTDDSQQVRTMATKSLTAYADVRSPKTKEVATGRKERALPTQPELSTGTGPLSSVGKRDEEKHTHATATPVPATPTHATDPELRKEDRGPLGVSEPTPTPIAVLSQAESAWKQTQKHAPTWAKRAFVYGGFGVVVAVVALYLSLQHVPSQTETKSIQSAAPEIQSNSPTSAPEQASASPLATKSESETHRSPASTSTRKHTSAPPLATQHESESNRPLDPRIDYRPVSRPSWWTDSDTGLMWATDDTKGDLNWEAANSYCTNMSLGGYSDWRLPTFIELQEICLAQVHSLRDLDSLNLTSGAFPLICSLKKGIDPSKVPREAWSSTPLSGVGGLDFKGFKALRFRILRRSLYDTDILIEEPSQIERADSHLSALCVRGSRTKPSPP